MLRLLGILFVAALAAALLFAACVSACGVAVVSVVAEGVPHFAAPVPLGLPLAALHLAPEHLFEPAGDEELDALGRAALLGLGELLRSLEGVEDAVLVEVRSAEEQVLVASEDGDLVVRVREEGPEGARVRIRAPLRALTEAAEACRSEDTALPGCGRRLVRSLLTHARGAEIEVRDGETGVDIRVR